MRDLRQRLAATGATLPAGDTYDDATRSAVRTFQERRGLRVDGICGPETWGALIESGFHLGDRLLYISGDMLRGDDVADLQRQLNALGFDAVREARVGRHVILDVDAADAGAAETSVRGMCDKLLANPVTEDYEIAGVRTS